MPVDSGVLREGKIGAKRRRMTRNRRTPYGLTGTWDQAEGGKGGEAHSHRTRRQTQACGVGRRDERWSMAGGRCGKPTFGWRFAPGEYVGSGCKREGIR